MSGNLYLDRCALEKGMSFSLGIVVGKGWGGEGTEWARDRREI